MKAQGPTAVLLTSMKKGKRLYSILRLKCPRCHGPGLFTNKSPFPLRELSRMPEHCAECGLKFEREPSFFYGSMYISYAYGVAVFVAVFVLVDLLLGYGIWTTVGTLAVVQLLASPWIFRLSRSTWINLFVSYDPSYSKKRLSSTSEGKGMDRKM